MNPLEQQLIDIYGLDHIPWWQTQWFLYTSLACASIIMLMSIVLFLYRRKVVKEQPVDLLTELNQCIYFIENGQGKVFYDHLTYLIKKAIEKGHEVSVDDKTEMQLVAYVEKNQLNIENKEQLYELCVHAQMMRFANIEIELEKMKLDLHAGKQIITHCLDIYNKKLNAAK